MVAAEAGKHNKSWPCQKALPFPVCARAVTYSCTDTVHCAGLSIRRMLSGLDAVDHKDKVDVQLGWFGSCSVTEAEAPAPQPDL